MEVTAAYPSDCDALEIHATPWMHTHPSLTMPADRSAEVNEQPALSKDTLIVQTLTADLQRAGVTSDVFGMVKRHGYLREWDQARWRQAEEELTQERLLQARRRYQAMGRGSMRTNRLMTGSVPNLDIGSWTPVVR